MCSKSKKILDLQCSKWRLILHYFVEISRRKQSNISEKTKEGVCFKITILIFFSIDTAGSFFDISDYVYA